MNEWLPTRLHINLFISRGWGQIQVLWDLKSKQIGGGSLLENEYEITNITLNKKDNIYLVDKKYKCKKAKKITKITKYEK